MNHPEWVHSFRGVLISPAVDRSRQNIALLKELPEQWAEPPADTAET